MIWARFWVVNLFILTIMLELSDGKTVLTPLTERNISPEYLTAYLTDTTTGAMFCVVPHTEDEAKAILAPYMGHLGRVFPAAWDRWEEFGEKMPDARLQVSRRSRASLLNDFGASAAKEIFRDTDVVLTDQPGFLLLVVESKIHVRLKKYRGRTCRTSGIDTTQRELFQSQQPVLTGFPDASNCIFGYVLKADASGYLETPITCSTEKKLHWRIDVPLPEAAQAQELRKQRKEVGEPGISSTIREDERAEEGGISG